MASIHYGLLKGNRRMPVGTIMPYTGENPPFGWLICDGRVLKATDYPLLAEALGDYYGGEITYLKGLGSTGDPIDIAKDRNTFESTDEFALPDFDLDQLLDIDTGMTSPSLGARAVPRRFFDDENAVVINEPIDNFVNTSHTVTMNLSFRVFPKFNMQAEIFDVELEGPEQDVVISVLPRKLGIEHTPAHTHKPFDDERFESAEQDVGSYAPTFIAPDVQVERQIPFQRRREIRSAPLANRSGSEINVISSSPSTTPKDEPNRHNTSTTLPVSWWFEGNEGGLDYTSHIPMSDAYDLRTSTADKIPPVISRPDIQKTDFTRSYTDTGTAISNVQCDMYRGSFFPNPGTYSNRLNYYENHEDVPNDRKNVGGDTTDGDNNRRTYSVTLNHNSYKFNDPEDDGEEPSVRGHHHSSIEFTISRGQMKRPRRLPVSGVQVASVNVETEENAIRTQVEVNSPGVVMLMIIKAF